MRVCSLEFCRAVGSLVLVTGGAGCCQAPSVLFWHPLNPHVMWLGSCFGGFVRPLQFISSMLVGLFVTVVKWHW